MIWKASKEMGVGRAVAQSGNVYIVVNYFPAGNKKGQFLENVLPATIKPPSQPNTKPNSGYSKRVQENKETGQEQINSGEEVPKPEEDYPELVPDKSSEEYIESTEVLEPEEKILDTGDKHFEENGEYFEEKKETITKRVYSKKVFKEEFSIAHNEFRALHGAPPLIITEKVIPIVFRLQ